MYIRERRKIYINYLKQFKNFHQLLIIPEYSKYIKPSYHLFFINILFHKINKNKDHFMKYLMKNKIMAQQHYIPIYEFSIYKKKKFFFHWCRKILKTFLVYLFM